MEPSEGTEVTTDTPVDDQDDDGGDKGNREAARYRRKLRDVEAQRDTALARVESMQRAEAERVASKHLAKGAALWVDGTALADVLDDDGDVDPAKVIARAQHVREEFGIGQSRRHVVPGEGNNPSARPTESMVDVVMGKR